MTARRPNPTDVTDEEWAFAAPYLTLMDPEARQRKYDLRLMLNALRWMARAGAPWRLIPHEFPPWEAVYQQTQRWLQAGCFEAMVNDLRSVLRTAQGKQGQPSAVILDGRTLQSTCESGPRATDPGGWRVITSVFLKPWRACTASSFQSLCSEMRLRFFKVHNTL